MTAVTILQVTPDALAGMIETAVETALRKHAGRTGELWSVSDMARHYGCTERTIRNRELAGDLPRRTGRHWRAAAVLEWDAARASG